MGTGVSTTVWSPEKLGGRSDPTELDILVFELEWGVQLALNAVH
jgi:hypothetical protein